MAKTKPKKSEPMANKQADAEQNAKPHQILLMSLAQSAIATEAWGKYAGQADLPELVTDLQTKFDVMHAGDLTSLESMLYGQAIALQTIFTSLARRSAANAGEYIDAADKYMRLALKAQSQCRATLETLAEIKNPRPVSFVRQANISNGLQQVNNGQPSGAGNSQTAQNELLEHQHGNYLDTGAQGAAGGTDTHLEAVGAVHRAEVASG